MFLGDIADASMLRRACEGVSAVVHAAGLAHVFRTGAGDSARFRETNETGTANVLDAAVKCGVPHVVLVSSVSVYGSYAGAMCDETAPCNPRGHYAVSKWHGELRAIERVANEEASLAILRFATIYGEGDRGNVARLIGALDRGHFIWPGSGENQKSLIYKDDAARACLHALERPLSGIEVFNVSARPVFMREIVSSICEALGRPVPRVKCPPAFLRAVVAASGAIGLPGQFGQRLQKFIHDDVYDASRFESTFDFQPAVSLSEGIGREVVSHLAQKNAERVSHSFA